MAPRKRSTRRASTRRGTTRRRTTRRTTRRAVRRRPKLATTLGSAAALAVIAFYTRASWPWRIGVTAAVLAALVLAWLWGRRGDIYDEMQDRAAAEGGRRDDEPQTRRKTGD